MARTLLKCVLLLIPLISGCKHESGGGPGNSGSSTSSSNSSSSSSGDSSSSSSSSSSGSPGIALYPFNPDHETAGGIQVELRGHSPEPIELNADNWYQETQQCVADWYAILYPALQFEFFDPPPVIIEPDPESICGNFDGFVNGIYCVNFALPIMVIRGGASYNFPNNWKHEFIHHILFMNEFDQTMSLNHQPDEIWSNCVI